MPTMSIRVEDTLHRSIEEAAGESGLSVSEWVRQAILAELGVDSPERWTAPVTMSKPTRLQLSMLHRIIELVADDDDEAEYHGGMVEVLREGFTGEYETGFLSISDELPDSDCRLVWDILDMFRMTKASIEQGGAEVRDRLDSSTLRDLTFAGFDFNDRRESRMASYAQFLTANDRWEELAGHFDADHESGNSHLPMLGAYERMLEQYRPLLRGMRGRLFTAEELRQIAGARSHPRRATD